MKKDALQEIYDNLQEGKRYGYYYAMRFPAFNASLYLTKENNIGWSHCGSSANDYTLEDLSWILENIFETTPEQFLKDYKVYDEETFRKWERIAEAQRRTDYRIWRHEL